jgi:4'-phosphopantetheinyl transferase
MPVPHSSWPVPFAIPALAEDEVHVWRANLDQARDQLGRWTRNLCAAERSRAERYVFERDQYRFVARRGILREILGGYLATGPDQLRFRYGRYGKPGLVDWSGPDMLHFNLSHSDGIAMFAFTYGRHIGIDVERVRADVACDDITAHFLNRRERRRLRSVEATERLRAFLGTWTCKEAYVKARGEGLSFPVEQVEVSLSPRALRRVGDDEEEALRWTLRELPAGGDYVAAIVVEGSDWRLRCWEWR